MKKKVKLFYGIFALFVLVLAILDLNSLLHVNANVISEPKLKATSFSIQINDYSIVQNNLNIDYSIFNAAPESKEIEINYQILDLNGKLLEEGTSEIVFDPSSKNSYKLSIPNQKSDRVANLRLSAFNGYLSTETEKTLNLKSQLTGFAIFEDKQNTSNLIVAILLIASILFVTRKIYRISLTSKRISGIKDNLIPLKIN